MYIADQCEQTPCPAAALATNQPRYMAVFLLFSPPPGPGQRSSAVVVETNFVVGDGLALTQYTDRLI